MLAIGLAALALTIGGVFAVRRIVVERDRADAAAIAALEEKRIAEEERARAERRSDQLTLSQAASIADTNPTLAIAMIKPLARTAGWRELLAVAAAARAAGVAWSLPASPVTTSLEMSRDGQRALAAGADGVVRVYDLAARAARVVAETGTPVRARFADAERMIVLWHADTLTVVDTTTGSRRDLGVAAPIRALEVIGRTAYWTDARGAVWQLDLAGTNPLQLPTDERILALAPSPDGRWIALAGEGHLLLLDRTQPAGPPLEVASGVTTDVSWASTGTRLTALIEDTALDVLMTPQPAIVQRVTVGKRSFIAFASGRVFTIGPTGVAIVSREGSGARRQLTGTPVGLFESRDGTVIAGSEKAIAVMSDRGDRTLTVPNGRLTAVQASPSSPYVIGTLAGRLLVWNLADLDARVLATGVASAHFAGRDQVLATFADGPARLIDFANDTHHELANWTAVTQVAAAPTGSLAAVVDLAHRAVLIGPGRAPQVLADEIDRVGFASEHQVLLHANSGTLQLHDTASNQRTVLVARTERLDGTGWSRSRPAWIATVFRDQTLWRKNLMSGAEDTIRVPKLPTSSLLVQPDGSVVFAVARELHAWRPDGTVQHHATFPRPVIELGTTGTARAVAFTEQGGAYVVHLDQRDQVVDLEESFGKAVSMAAETGLIVEPKDGVIEVVDPLIDSGSRRRWKLAEAANVSYLEPQISTDGRHVIARAGARLLLWPLALPGSQAEAITWLDRLTNAVSESGSKGLDWK